METLNIQCIEQQQVLITLTLTDSNGAPVDLTQYAVYAASVGAVDPYCRRAARLEWATAINNECSAFIITAPGHDIARAPWKYQICIKNRQLGLEWAVVTGRVELTPRACGTDGISPASYSVACEANPSGLVNVTLDATVGSISGTLEQVKASAAAAAAAAQSAHADLEDAETAATKASQAALAAASDARIASDKATAAEAAATAAPEACAPYVQQVQQAAASALDASRTATTAAAGAQASADAAAPAQGYATRAESAQAAAVQAAETATTAATTATEQAESATAQAESARLAATTASTASDNAQAAATRAEDAATRAEDATPAAARAEAARDAAEAAAASATTAAADLPQLTQRAETAATASETAQQAAESAQSTATTAATTATAQAEAAAASATQADTDARACAIYDQRVAANATAAADSATAAADSAAAAADSATAAADSATAAADSARELLDDELNRMVDVAAAAYGLMEMGAIQGGYVSEIDQTTGVPRIWIGNNSQYNSAKIVVYKGAEFVVNNSAPINKGNVLYAPDLKNITNGKGRGPFTNKGNCYMHAPNLETTSFTWFPYDAANTLVMSPQTKFEKLRAASDMIKAKNVKIIWATGTKFSALVQANSLFYGIGTGELPDEFTFENLSICSNLFAGSAFTKLPASMTLKSLTSGVSMLHGCANLEVDEIVRVVSTIQDLQSLETPKTGTIGLPTKCYHAGEVVSDTRAYLNTHHPDFLTTLAAKGWTVTFG